jgi:hypothetical protein
MKLNRFDSEKDLNEALAKWDKEGVEVIGDVKIVMLTSQSPVNGAMIQQPVFYILTKQRIVLAK